jgi:AcrR family transcriptional regulator
MSQIEPETDPMLPWRFEQGKKRREETRLRLIRAALSVFAEVGSEGATIDQIIAAAGVARGSFYNHFKTIAELESAVAVFISVELSSQILTATTSQQDPAVRIATAVRYFLHMVGINRKWGWVIVRTGLTGSLGDIVRRNLLSDLVPGFSSGRFTAKNSTVAMDLILGTSLVAMQSILTNAADANHPSDVAAAILVALGITRAEAEVLATARLPQIATCQPE